MAPHLSTPLLRVFVKNPQWHLIISLGGISKEKICLENLPLNVTIFDFAPQREILQYADLVLTHGGHGTIKECIEAGVPRLYSPVVMISAEMLPELPIIG